MLTSDRRIGRFMITRECFDDDIEGVQSMLSKCVILKCEFDYAQGWFEYTAWCKQFDEISIGEIAPTYVPIIHTVSGQIYKFTFERLKSWHGS